jgi:DNA-directed RNA polymerase beta' subunit/intein/homing endonuclease
MVLYGKIKKIKMFDGDEMNIHLAQSIQARNELKRIANVQYQIVSVKDSSPIIGCQQDTLSGAYMLTDPSVRMKGWEVANLLCNTTSDTKMKIEMDKEYTGHEIFSHIIPVGINMIKKSGDKVALQITNGKLVNGYLDKSALSFAKNSIIHFIWDKFGPSKTRRFIDDSQRLVLSYLLMRGQTVGFDDTIVDSTLEKQIDQFISNKILEAKYNITQYENETEQISPQIIESTISQQLNMVQPSVGQMLMSRFDINNFFWAAAKSGAKGNASNVAQVIGTIGQTNITGEGDGVRLKKNVEGRSLIYFHRDDDTPEARGFIKNSFFTGLKGYEFFVNAKAGRMGLIDSAIKSVTWETPIVIIENNKPKYTEIGRWIDNHLDENAKSVEHYEERQMELLALKDGVYIPTTDYNGNVSWGAVSAVTRHDPGTELYEIKTSGGRSVIVTESKSLLVWNNDTKQFKEMLTPDIKVGDSVPVTMELCDSPITMKYIDVSNYLPKTEYIYGSDYNKAIRMMTSAMENVNKIPAGWWEENNGNEFTLPYTKKASLQRCLIRSNQENIKSGYVFPYGARRNDTLIPDNFELTEENGIFIGLFLAEGNVNNDSVRITNTNDNIKTFVKSWFDKHSINWDEEDRENNIGGRTNSIRGFSGILATFLTKLVGHGAENKFVPSEAFIAPEPFIIGLLNGYFSGDGCVTKNSIDSTSASSRLTEGISMLCSRIGVFCKVYKVQLKSNNLGTENIKPSYRIRISAQWAKQFSQKVTLLEENKNKKMKEKDWSDSHQKFESYNNVVLDPIVEINLIDVAKHPKVYDLTIPSTFNFGLANGLQVRDTAQTGYIQRQLIKGLEDLYICYDGTNRNARGTIIQSVYGENGINQATQTELQLNILAMDNKTLEEKLGFSDQMIKKIESSKKLKLTSKQLKDFNEKHNDKLKGMRDELRTIQCNAMLNYKTMAEKFVSPVNLFRITQDYTMNNDTIELTPMEIVEAIENFLNDYDNRLITSLKPSDKFMKRDDRCLKFLLEVAMHEYLAPVKCIFEYKLSKDKFYEMMAEIKMSFIKAIIEPGEMVGIIAAQSIGEPTSQITLNTKHSAGAAGKGSANMGVSRIQELLHFSKNIKTPQMSIYFNDIYANDRSGLNKIVSYFRHLSIRQLISSAEVYYDMAGNDMMSKKIRGDNVSGAFFVNNMKAEISSMPFVFRIKMDIEKMMDKETSLLDIKTRFISHWYKNYTNLKNLKKNEKEVISRISRCGILSNSAAEKEQIIHVRFSMSSFNYNIITEFLRMIFDDISLKGIENIDSTDVSHELRLKFDKETGEIKSGKEYVVTTDGINFEKMRLIKGLDMTRTKCNDIATTLRLYGIEATRQMLIYELTETYNNSGSSINNNHLSLLVDQMCHSGEITSIDRHGMSKIEMDPIARASFEKTMDHFVNAAVFNEKDTMRSVSSRIAVGRVMAGGTGIFDLLLDTKKLENSEYTEDETGGRITYTPLEEEPLLEDIMKYSVGKTDFFIPKNK